MIKCSSASLAVVLASCAVLAQAPANPQFDAASIKVADSRLNGGIADAKFFPERFVATNVTLQQLIMEAYELEGPEIVGGPDWVHGARATLFDVTAVAGANVGVGTMRTMLQALLADRFQLQLEREVRTGTVYTLTAGKTKGLQSSRDPAERPVVLLIPDDRGGTYRLHYEGHNATMDTLALMLAGLLKAPVSNKTELKGGFDFRVTFAAPQAPVGIPPDANAPVIFTALETELGLKLVAERGPISQMVIRQASPPSAN